MSDINNKYNNKVHFYGRISAVIFLLSTFLIPLTLWLKFGLLPTKEGFIAGFTTIMLIMVPASLGEFLSFAPIIGSSAYYVMLLSGNFMNIRVPSSIVALEATELDANSEEGDAISTIAVAVSAITSEVVIVIGVLMLAPFTKFFAIPAIKIGFDQIVPSLFGALFIASAIKNYKAVIVPTVLGIIIIKFQLIPSLYTIPALIFSSVIVTIILYKLGFYTKNKTEEVKKTA
ncbi:MAG: hypothetical protein FH753_12415 [Firmicutes bacterium]|nr:hypothetical protein [Bacillota bacterium]